MSRKRIHQINRFDGGMTHDIRDLSDPSKCAFSSHFDIYGNPHEISVMPGYVSDQQYQGVDDGLKQFNVRAFWYDNNIMAVGNKADGTGTKTFHKTDPTDTEWLDGASAGFATEGSDNLVAAPYARIATSDDQEKYVTTTAGGTLYLTEFYTSVTDKFATIQTSNTGTSNPFQLVRGADAYSDRLWFNRPYGDVGSINDGGTVTVPRWDTGSYYVNSMVESSRGLWTCGYTFQPYNTEIRLWDRNATLADQIIQIPNTRGGAIGLVGGVPVVVLDEYVDTLKGTGATAEQENGLAGFSIRAISGVSTETIYRYTAPTYTGGRLLPVSNQFKDSFLFYGKFATDLAGTTFRQGIWAVGRSNVNRPLAPSLLLDTTDLGQLDGYHGFSNHHYFAHAGDGSISRLDRADTGTYDVTATYESLLLFSDTPLEKQFNGLTIRTNDLPAGGSVTAYYRTDPDDSWTSMGTRNTAGDSGHTFTTANGAVVNNFTEIQFKMEVVGKIKVKELVVSAEEMDNLPYNL